MRRCSRNRVSTLLMPVITSLFQTSVISKLLECLVSQQLQNYSYSTGLLPTLQSGFRPPCRTFYQTFCQLSTGEMLQHRSVRPICCIRHDQSRDSAAELTESFSIVGAALKWFQSYLTSRTQYIRHGTLNRLYSLTDTWCSTGLCAWADLVHHIYS